MKYAKMGVAAMSHKETTDLSGPEAGESASANLSRLTGMARQAYEQKRTKECLDLTRAILLIDPANADAQWMRSSIQSEMQRDLDNVRAVLLQAYSKDEVKPADAVEAVDVLAPNRALDRQPEISPADSSDLVTVNARLRYSRRRQIRWAASAAAFLLAAGLTISLAKRLAKSTLPEQRPPSANTSVIEHPAPPSIPPPAPPPAAAAVAAAAAPPPPPSRPVAAAVTPAAATAASPASRRDAPSAPVPPALGTLAVSSPTPVDIYRDGAFVGSTPVSLQLPAGMQTLEYRHANLRKIVTHTIKADDTTKAMISFDIVVRINSRPWTEVYLDGTERKDLGQTPLSSVQVPIGSTLSFENPQYPPKKYRVTGNETGIQIVLP